MKRDFLRITDLQPTELEAVLDLAARLKSELRARKPHPLLAGRTLAMIFEKPSLRTRVTFEVGMVQLGGAAVSLAQGDIKLGEREPASDIARNLERWVDLILARVFLHQSVLDLATAARVPVINGLSDLHHPCQVLADSSYRASRPHRRAPRGLRGRRQQRGAFVDGAAARLGFDFVLAARPGERTGIRPRPTRVTITHDVDTAVPEPTSSTPTSGRAWGRSTRPRHAGAPSSTSR
jgi:ornithine carbamoyltransferase